MIYSLSMATDCTLELVEKPFSVEEEQIQKAQEFFRRDTAQHEIEVLLSSPETHTYHIAYAKPGTRIASVLIMTYPEGLLYTGDMGEFVFRRHGCRDLLAWWPGSVSSYIREKCVAGEADEYSEERALEQIASQYDWDDDVDDVIKAARLSVLEGALLGGIERESDYYDACFGKLEFDEVPRPTIPTIRFVWACEAIRTVADYWRKAREAGTL